VKTGNLAFDVGDWSEEEQVALVRLMAQYEELPVSWETTKRAAVGLASDPTTYLGLSFVLSALSKIALKPMAANAVKRMLVTTSGAGTVGAVEVGGYMGVDNVFQQKIKIDTGQQSDYDLVETAMMTGAGVIAGYTLIGGLTALTSRGAGKMTRGVDDTTPNDTVLDAADEVVGEADEVVDDAVEEVADEVVEEVVEEVDETTDLLDEFDEADTANENDWLAEMESQYKDELGDDDFDFLMSGVEDEFEAPSNFLDEVVAPVEKLKPTTVMPKGLAGSKPRYGYGDTNYKVKFESDVDKALYIVASKGPKLMMSTCASYLVSSLIS